MEPWIWVISIIVLVVVAVVVSGIKVVPQAKAYVIERLGAYHETWQTGLHWDPSRYSRRKQVAPTRWSKAIPCLRLPKRN